jgi:hypothetical protein
MGTQSQDQNSQSQTAQGNQPSQGNERNAQDGGKVGSTGGRDPSRQVDRNNPPQQSTQHGGQKGVEDDSGLDEGGDEANESEVEPPREQQNRMDRPHPGNR